MNDNPFIIELSNVSLYLRDNYFSIQKEFKFSSDQFLEFKHFFENPDNPAKVIFEKNYEKFLEMKMLIDSGQTEKMRDLNQSVLSIPFQKLNDTIISKEQFALYFSFKRNKNILMRLGPPNETKTSIQAKIKAWKRISDPIFKNYIDQLLEQYERDSKPNILKFDISIQYANNQNKIRISKSEDEYIEEDFDLNEDLLHKIKNTREILLDNEKLPTESELNAYYDIFKQKFGPDTLSQLDGIELLDKLHDLQDPNSLAYWLEFKNDDEFPAIFGGISGGSALKYKIYRRKETGKWTTGSSRDQYEISEAKAIEFARLHRDQFIEGCKILEKMPSDPSKVDYKQLQLDMDELVPDLSNRAWGRKYFSLIFPDILDDFHSSAFQRTRLTQIHLKSELGDGRYINSWFFMKLKKVLGFPMNHITSTLKTMFKSPYKYWIYQVQNLEDKQELLDFMKENEVLCIPLQESGDLNQFDMSSIRVAKETILKYLIPRYSGSFNNNVVTKQLINFKRKLKTRDIIIVADQTKIKGMGRISEDSKYEYKENAETFAHQLQMNWVDFTEWNLIELATRKYFQIEEKLFNFNLKGIIF